MYLTAHAVPFDGFIVVGDTDDLFSKKAASATLYPPGRPTEIVRDVFLFAKPIAVVGSGKAALKAAGVEDKQDGVLVVENKDVNTLLDAFEGLLKTFKFLGRYALDS